MRRTTSGRKHNVEFLFPIVLFLIFSIAAISVILFAAGVYKREVEMAQEHYTTRTSLEYLTEKVHRSDAEGAVSVGTFCGADALILEDVESGGKYVTYIYCLDGSLRELYALKGADVDGAAGTAIIPLKDFQAEMTGDHFLTLSCTDTEDRTQSAITAIRSGK